MAAFSRGLQLSSKKLYLGLKKKVEHRYLEFTSSKNVKLGSFKSGSSNDGKEMSKRRDARSKLSFC